MNANALTLHFSPELFWDTAPESVCIVKNKRWLVVRVLEYGHLEDWLELRKLYSLAEIAEAASQARCLSPKALSFISIISETPKESFRCFAAWRVRSLALPVLCGNGGRAFDNA